MKQAARMQQQMEQIQNDLAKRTVEATSGGGAVKIKVNGAGKFTSLVLDPEFLKEDPKLITETLLVAMQDAAKQAKDYNDAEMQKITSAFQAPGIF